MSITINEALEIEILKDFRIIAGRKGLDNKITRVGILDHETPEIIEKTFTQGEFIITNLLLIKDNIDELFLMVEKMITVGVSGVAIKNIYFDEIPNKVVELANNKAFPIMMFSGTYMEDIITSVMNLIKERDANNALSLKLDNILYGNLDSVIIKKIAYEVNGNFKEKNMVAFCKRINNKNTILMDSYLSIHETKPLNKIIPYKDGIVFINTFEDTDTDTETANSIVLRRLEAIGVSAHQYTIGISSLYNKLGELNLSLKESLYAFKYSKIYGKDISFFSDIGINKVLLPIIDNPWVLKYHHEIIEPLIVHDNKYETELLKTAIVYIENNGDIKATANELFQHGNTIRYRIDKISKILIKNGKRNNNHFYEELAMAVRIYNIINAPL